jgi:two-component system, sensor histidine kinase and response regulator
MSKISAQTPELTRIAARALALFADMKLGRFQQIDHLFAGLLVIEWLAAIIVAVLISPLAWAGVESQIHIHVWAAIFLGGAIVGLPVYLALTRPGFTITRQVVAVGQMLIGVLLIHLSGGRIETHFFIFGSLAFLAFYRDWPVIVTASIVVALDHGIRGIYWPRSLYGVLTISLWRWAEHVGWVLFEDVFLIRSCVLTLGELREIAFHRAEIEDSRDQTERTVETRTDELCRANAGLKHEIVEREQAETALRKAKVLAESVSRSKSQFLANMSHEIRTPMNGIIGMTDLALDTELSQRQREYLRVVKSSAESLLNVINDILDFSKIEAGKLSLDPVSFALRDALGETLQTLALRACTQGLELACRIAPEVPDNLVGDIGRIRQVLVNLVGNAIKFTERGEVVVTVATENEGDQCIRLRISVADTGIGISARKVQAIFEPFEQADGSTTRRFGGTGLGLSISCKLVEMMDGIMRVDSELGRGSTFWFTMLLGMQTENASKPGRAAPSLVGLEGLPILIVDDNATNRVILAEILTSWGAHPVAVAGGREALVELRSAVRRGQPYSVALIDVVMPEMDGLDVAYCIRCEPAIAAARLLLLTSADRPEDAVLCQALQISACLTKPVRQSELFDALMNVMASGNSVSESRDARLAAFAGPKSIPTGVGLHILLAEDHVVNQKVAVRMLESMGHSVVVAPDGRQAIATLATDRFDVILMDVQMPEMDGFEAVRSIRQREARTSRHIPILALTAHAMQGDRDRCLQAGFDGYLAKPIRQNDLKGALAAIRFHVPEITSPKLATLAKLKFIAQEDGEFAREVAESFLEEAPRCLAQMNDAIQAVDGRRLAADAHGLKGISLTVGADDLAASCQALEDAGRSGDFGDAPAEVARACRAWEHVRTELEAFAGFVASPVKVH